MKPRRCLAPVVAGAVFILAVPPPPSEGGIVLYHPPDQSGACTSDTSYLQGVILLSQQLADDFILDTDATIHQVTWWGAYWDTPPPTSETFRIRLYGIDVGDGLPGNLLFESTVFNPLRQATGLRVVGGGVSLTEYVFEVNLGTPISLNLSTPYWLEIAQFGDPNSRFEWELSSVDPNGFAFQYPSGAQWQLTSSTKDLAFRLSTIPEPGTLVLIILGFNLATRSRSHRLHMR